MRCIAGLVARETAGGGDPAGMPTHDLHHEDLGRGARHGGDIERRLARGDGDVFRDRAEAGTAVGVRQIVVDRLRHADTGDRIAQGLADLRDLERGVHGVVAAVVEEIPDVVRFEDLDEALVFGAVLLEALQLEARRAEGARRGVLQPADGGGALLAHVDEVFREGADDAVPAGVDLADVLRLLHRGLDDTRRGGVDDGGDTARLGVKSVFPDRLFHGVLHDSLRCWRRRRAGAVARKDNAASGRLCPLNGAVPGPPGAHPVPASLTSNGAAGNVASLSQVGIGL